MLDVITSLLSNATNTLYQIYFKKLLRIFVIHFYKTSNFEKDLNSNVEIDTCIINLKKRSKNYMSDILFCFTLHYTKRFN